MVPHALWLLLIGCGGAIGLQPAVFSPIAPARALPTPRHARAPPPVLLGARTRVAPGVVPLGGQLQADRTSFMCKRTARRRRGESKERARSGAEQRRDAAVRDGVMPFEWLLVLDVEATCDVRGRDWEHEIIEFPVVALNLRTLQVEHEFHSFVRPTINGTLTPFCTKLTGITQDIVDPAPHLDQVLRSFDAWLADKGFVNTPEKRTFAFCADGHFDLQFFLDGECARKRIPKPEYFDKWVNLKQLFADHYKTRRCKIAKMLDIQGMKFEGRLHSGIDDSRNIARIAAKLIEDGSPMYINEGLPPRTAFRDL